jgi:hypothetical protein
MKSDKSSQKKKINEAAKPMEKRTVPSAAAKPGPPAAAPPPSPKADATAKNTTPAAAPASVPAKVKSPAKREAPAVPPLLLEGDQPSPPPAAGPGQRYALGPVPPPEHLGGGENSGELPEAYGTKQLLLAARDPHWLYAHWDLTREQRREYNRRATDGHLAIRIFINAISGSPLSVVQVHPESTHWFIHVAQAGAKYLAELGYFQADGKWISISKSGATLTPPDAMSEDTSAQFATIPIEVPFAQLMALATRAVRENLPLAEVLLQLRASGYQIPEAPAAAGQWTPEQERALASIITMDRVRRVWMGSLEITELLRRQLRREMSSLVSAQFSLPSSPMGAISSISSISSPFGGQERRKGFWFNVNAELIIYGATEPDAQVTIGGRPIKLRPDGTFSFRFALPDGDYELPAIAVSADKTDGRAAELKFARGTRYRGEVGAHPQDPRLKPPVPASVA